MEYVSGHSVIVNKYMRIMCKYRGVIGDRFDSVLILCALTVLFNSIQFKYFTDKNIFTRLWLLHTMDT